MFAYFSRCTSIALFLAAAFLGGCANSNLPPAPRNVAPVAAVAPELPPYLIQVGDILEVKMLLNPEFDQELIVRPDGMLSTTIAQNVPAYGRTPQQLQDALTKIYRSQLSSPQLSIIVKTFTPQRVYVLGEVNSPGEFVTVGPNLTVMQALARAGGVKLTADTKGIVIVRRGAAEQPQVYAANIEEAISGKDGGADVRLASYDVVFVPRTGIAEVHKAFNQYIQQFVPASFGLSYSLNPDNN